jgi:hypothetical protein
LYPDIISDFRGVGDIDDITERFYSAARAIIFCHELVYGESRWSITALELYLFTTSPVWQDPNTHRDSEQHNSATWYVHHGGDRPPNRSGIDVTAGSKIDNMFCGLLVRAINNVDGPGRACGFSPQPNSACELPGGYPSRSAQKTIHGVQISVSSPLLDGYDEPEILRSSTHQICLTGADAGQIADRQFMAATHCVVATCVQELPARWNSHRSRRAERGRPAGPAKISTWRAPRNPHPSAPPRRQ